jgi:hypothetical protein
MVSVPSVWQDVQVGFAGLSLLAGQYVVVYVCVTVTTPPSGHLVTVSGHWVMVLVAQLVVVDVMVPPLPAPPVGLTPPVVLHSPVRVVPGLATGAGLLL